MWACPRTPTSVVFTRVLGDQRAIRRGGGGTQAHITPYPRAAITIKSAQHARSAIIHHIFLKTPGPSVFTRALGERRAIRRGGGGTQAHINPLPPDCDHPQNAIARAPQDQSYFLKGPMLGSGPQPRPPPTRASRPPPTFLCSVISNCLYEVHYEVSTLLTTCKVVCTVCMSVCLGFSTHC